MSFADDYYAQTGGVDEATYVERHIRGSAAEMERIRSTIALLPAGTGSVLDVGAGHGVLLEELAAARGVRGTGVEITPGKVEYARSRGVDLRLGNAEHLAFDDRSFDAVVACEVIEHLPYGVYERALAELARVARATVLLSVPCEERRVFVRCPYCGASVNPNYHFRSFDAAAMATLPLPGWRLVGTHTLGWHRDSLLLRIGRHLLDRGWPATLVCASCGYRAAPPSAPSTASAGTGAPSLRDRAQRLSMRLPARRRPNWLLGVYARAD